MGLTEDPQQPQEHLPQQQDLPQAQNPDQHLEERDHAGNSGPCPDRALWACTPFPGTQAYPFWSLIIIAIDMFIIWALLAKTGDAG